MNTLAIIGASLLGGLIYGGLFWCVPLCLLIHGKKWYLGFIAGFHALVVILVWGAWGAFYLMERM